MGIALYSPLINDAMNSVRGLQFAHHLVSKFPLHEFDSVKPPSILKFLKIEVSWYTNFDQKSITGKRRSKHIHNEVPMFDSENEKIAYNFIAAAKQRTNIEVYSILYHIKAKL